MPVFHHNPTEISIHFKDIQQTSEGIMIFEGFVSDLNQYLTASQAAILSN